MDSLALSLVLGIMAHFVGDYLLQTDWMAQKKTTQWWPAILHGVTYTLPFLFITQSPLALLVIGGTHILIDRFRLAKYIVWAKNQLAPKQYRPMNPWRKPKPKPEIIFTGPFQADRLVTGTISATKLSVTSLPVAKNEKVREYADPATGMPKSTPAWMGVWLMIIADNTTHVVINSLALWLL